jgi:hypothetical protein
MRLNHQRQTARAVISVPSRRDVLRGLAGVGFGLGAAWNPAASEAKKRRGKRRKKYEKPKPNAFGCLEVGDACKNVDQCCSGICQGKKCRAHDTGTCDQAFPGVCAASNPILAACNNDQCFCFRTTGGSNVCAEGFGAELSQCADCSKDADCLALGMPPGTACALVSKGPCSGICPGAMACLLPCGTQLPCPFGQDECGGNCLLSCELDEFRNRESCECEACIELGDRCGADVECCGENVCRVRGNETVCVFPT